MSGAELRSLRRKVDEHLAAIRRGDRRVGPFEGRHEHDT